MTETLEERVPAAAGAPALDPANPDHPTLDRLSDLMNPVLLRELRQSIRSRGFVFGMALTLVAVAVVAVGIALERPDEGEAFFFSLAALCLVSVLLVPFRAMGSLGKEVESGLSEQILLSRLSPGRIVDGHLLAASAHVGLVLSLFAPLLALTYLLRGVDVPTVLISLYLAATAAVGAAALAAALGAMTRFQQAKSLIRAAAAFGMVWLAFGLMALAGSGELMDEFVGEQVWYILAYWTGGLILAVWLCRLVATAILTHPFENRSTGFRIHTVVTTCAVLGAVAGTNVLLSSIASLTDVLPVFAVFAIGMASPFWLFAVTEEEGLTPRVRATVPKRRFGAFLGTFLLPGGGRGFLFMLLHLGLIVLLGAVLPEAARRASGTSMLRSIGVFQHETAWQFPPLQLAIVYSVIYGGFGRLVRGWLGPGAQRTWLARGLVLLALTLGCVLPILGEALLTGDVSGWGAHHALNPFWTIAENARRPSEELYILAVPLVLVVLGNARAIRAGVAEVFRASAARRAAGV